LYIEATKTKVMGIDDFVKRLESSKDRATDRKVAEIKSIIKTKNYALLMGGKSTDYDPRAVIEKLRKTGKYIVDETSNATWRVTKNHNYKSTWLPEIAKGLITAGFALLVGWLLQLSDRRENNREVLRLNARIDSLRGHADSTLHHLPIPPKDTLPVSSAPVSSALTKTN
jgi:hypothetical protein